MTPRDFEPDALPDNRNEDRRVAHTMALAAGALALLIVPFYQGVEWLLDQTAAEYLWMHARWRGLVVVTALVTLIWCGLHPDGRGAPLLLRVFSASVMVMMFGMFATDYLHQAPSVDRMVQGLIMTTFAISLISLRGGRELLALFGVPFTAMLIVLAANGVPADEVIVKLLDPLMMAVVAVVMSEVFHRTRLRVLVLDSRLRKLASMDALTGLHNRRNVEQRIDAEISRSRRHGVPFSIVIGDLDHFKRINDEYGHAVGDDILRGVGRRILDNLRAEDLAVRWGGEEFLLMLPNSDARSARTAADKLRRLIGEQPFTCDGRAITVTISFGVAQFSDDRQVLELVKRADRAMYRAKQAGRNRVQVAVSSGRETAG